jgi:PAP2 superfamily
VLHTIRPTWENVWSTAALLLVLGALCSTARNRFLRAAAPFCFEGFIIGLLYGLWQLAAKISVTGVGGAFARARWIERFQADIHLPSEISAQKLVLGHKYLIETANLYYASMHLTMMLVFLIWLFWRHREQYRPVRTLMAWVTLLCLIVQLMPVAPPRMLPGFVDTAWYYGQSVYAGGLPFDQLSAMPSVHVAWAVLIGYYAWRVSPSKWRYVAPLHAVLTVIVVVITANHWWLDGIVATLILVLTAWAQVGVRTLWWQWRRRSLTQAASDRPDVGEVPEELLASEPA